MKIIPLLYLREINKVQSGIKKINRQISQCKNAINMINEEIEIEKDIVNESELSINNLYISRDLCEKRYNNIILE